MTLLDVHTTVCSTSNERVLPVPPDDVKTRVVVTTDQPVWPLKVVTGRRRGPNCPDRRDLEALAKGHPTIESLEMLADHVASCPHCSLVLEELEKQSNSLRSRLTAAYSGDRLLQEPQYEQMEACVRMMATDACARLRSITSCQPRLYLLPQVRAGL